MGVFRNPSTSRDRCFANFWHKGYDAVPVNPQATEIDGRKCFARVADMIPPVEAALVMTGPPEATDQAIRECNQLEIRNIWIYKSVDDEPDHEHTVELCRLQGTAVSRRLLPDDVSSPPRTDPPGPPFTHEGSGKSSLLNTMSFFRIALKNLLRRRLRTTLTLCGVAVGIAAFVALVGFSRSFEEQWVKLYESSGTDIAVVQKTFLNTFVDESVGEKLRALPFVAAADPVIVNLMDLTPEVNALVYGWPANSFEMDTLTLLQGRRFRDDQPEVMLGEVLAENLGKKPGDAMDMQGSTYRMVGVFRGGSALEAGAAVLPLRELQKLSDLGGKVTAFHVHLRKGYGGESEAQLMQNARAAIEAAFPGLKALPASMRARNNQLVVLARSMAWGTSAHRTFHRRPGHRQHHGHVGLRAHQGNWCLARLGLEALTGDEAHPDRGRILGLVGGCFGVAGGWLALRILEGLPFTASFVTSSIPLAHCVEALLIAVVVGLLAGFLPAQRGARLSPVEALRYE